MGQSESAACFKITSAPTPKALPVWETVVEEQDGIVTTGGSLSSINLALHVIKCLAGPDVAKLTADISVANSVPMPQLVYAPRFYQ